MHVPVVSTGHVPFADHQQILQRGDFYFQDPHSWVCIMIEDGPTEWDDYSPEFQAVVAFFHNLGYRYLRLDGECGDVIPELPTYPWP